MSTTVLALQSRLQPAVLPSGASTRKPSPAWLSTSGSPSESFSGGCGWLVLHTNGVCCGPEKIGPVIGWFVDPHAREALAPADDGELVRADREAVDDAL